MFGFIKKIFNFKKKSPAEAHQELLNQMRIIHTDRATEFVDKGTTTGRMKSSYVPPYHNFPLGKNSPPTAQQVAARPAPPPAPRHMPARRFSSPAPIPAPAAHHDTTLTDLATMGLAAYGLSQLLGSDGKVEPAAKETHSQSTDWFGGASASPSPAPSDNWSGSSSDSSDSYSGSSDSGSSDSSSSSYD